VHPNISIVSKNTEPTASEAKGFNLNNPQFRFTSLEVKDLVKTGTLTGFNINNLT